MKVFGFLAFYLQGIEVRELALQHTDGISGHTVGEAYYDGAWHLFDVLRGFQAIYRHPLDGHIMSYSEVVLHPEVVLATQHWWTSPLNGIGKVGHYQIEFPPTVFPCYSQQDYMRLSWPVSWPGHKQIQEALGENPAQTEEGLRKLCRIVAGYSEELRVPIFCNLLGTLEIPHTVHGIHTPQAQSLQVVEVGGLDRRITSAALATVDPMRSLVFTSPEGKLCPLADLQTWPDYVAAERQPPYATGEAYETAFSSGPRHLTVYIGDVCNADCIMCWQAQRRTGGGPDSHRGILKPQIFSGLLDKYGMGLDSLEFSSFGEPLVHPQFDILLEDMVQVLRRQQRIESNPFMLNIITNGALLHQHLALLSVPGYLTFSIDAAQREAYETIRRGLKWDQVLDNLTTAVKHPNKHPFRRVGVNFVLFEDNLAHLSQMARLCSDLGTSYLSVLLGAGMEGTPAEYRRIPADDPRLSLAIDHARDLCPNLLINDYASDRKAPEALPEVRPGRRFCPLPWRQMDIGIDGRAHPCCRSHYHTDLGQAMEDPWRGDQLSKLRQQILAGKVNSAQFPDCAKCPYLGMDVEGSNTDAEI